MSLLLNESQYEAITYNAGPLLVIAGAGTGKTRVITHKIAYLIKELGISPEQILAVTFTNKAADEMLRRVVQLTGKVAHRIWIGTFHSHRPENASQGWTSCGAGSKFFCYRSG